MSWGQRGRWWFIKVFAPLVVLSYVPRLLEVVGLDARPVLIDAGLMPLVAAVVLVAMAGLVVSGATWLAGEVRRGWHETPER
ncbi:hypothetical protein SAMN04488570_1134 [Nocardioides scoriae]|uniref:Uncharacterized protein n=1 Tax=Nocardioides scoriae TaxID=642780 RepID=A0A1H1PGA5_9ACTN|nr:hypothetical protein SAMN04488570_1134 [Nocardioides scoriae]